MIVKFHYLVTVCSYFLVVLVGIAYHSSVPFFGPQCTFLKYAVFLVFSVWWFFFVVMDLFWWGFFAFSPFLCIFSVLLGGYVHFCFSGRGFLFLVYAFCVVFRCVCF